jgi:formylglycine-generating enzyme required for sulfatase activity
MTPRPISVVAAAATALATVLLLLAPGCREEQPAEERILVLDGLEIRRADVAPYLAFIDSFRPEVGWKTKVQMILDEHLIPLLAARRALGPERERMRQQAEALVSVADNVLELERRSEQLEHKRRMNLTRTMAKLPVGIYLFQPERTGGVSPPIEVPQGWFVVASYDLHESPLVLGDWVDALQVGFVTHTNKEWADWLDQEKLRLAGLATFVHPDYRDAMPAWIQLPNKP